MVYVPSIFASLSDVGNIGLNKTFNEGVTVNINSTGDCLISKQEDHFPLDFFLKPEELTFGRNVGLGRLHTA